LTHLVTTALVFWVYWSIRITWLLFMHCD